MKQLMFALKDHSEQLTKVTAIPKNLQGRQIIPIEKQHKDNSNHE